MAQADTDNSTTLPAPEKAQESSDCGTYKSPQDAFKAIYGLRKQARAEIDRLIRFLDETDNHMELEEGADDAPCDDTELEPSLGSFDRMLNHEKSYRQTWGECGDCGDDIEQDDCDNEDNGDREPDLGWSRCGGLGSDRDGEKDGPACA